jgi:hypothetical protein
LDLDGHSLLLSASWLRFQLLQASPREIQIGRGSPPARLPEGVQDVHCLFELGDVDDPMLELAANPDLGDTGTESGRPFTPALYTYLYDLQDVRR